MSDLFSRAYRAVNSGLDEHISDGQWERWAMKDLSCEEQDSLLEHVTACPECAAIYRAVRIVANEAHTFDPGAPKPQSHDRAASVLRFPRRILMAAAALAAVVGLALVLRPVVGVGPVAAPQVRSAGTDTAPQPVEPTGPESSRPASFKWEPVKGARGYVVELFDKQGGLVWTSPETDAREIDWPDQPRAAEGLYYWRVTAIGPDGSTWPSDLVSFTIPPASPMTVKPAQ